MLVPLPHREDEVLKTARSDPAGAVLLAEGSKGPRVIMVLRAAARSCLIRPGAEVLAGVKPFTDASL